MNYYDYAGFMDVLYTNKWFAMLNLLFYFHSLLKSYTPNVAEWKFNITDHLYGWVGLIHTAKMFNFVPGNLILFARTAR